MAFVYPLCSSSKGNCYYIGDRENGILLDAGVGPRNFVSLLKLNDIPPQAVRGIFITHEHHDHVCGLKKLTGMLPVPVFGTRGTLEQLILKDHVDEQTDLYEIHNRAKEVGGFVVEAFDTPHDSAHSVGYCIHTNDGKKISLCTDLGYMPASVSAKLNGSDFVVIESNYDEAMLQNGSYPYHLKQRIGGRRGHLSNPECAEEIKRLLEQGTRRFLLAHLSEENNRPEVALAHTINTLSECGLVCNADYKLAVAPKKSIGKLYEL